MASAFSAFGPENEESYELFDIRKTGTDSEYLAELHFKHKLTGLNESLSSLAANITFNFFWHVQGILSASLPLSDDTWGQKNATKILLLPPIMSFCWPA